MSSVKRCSEWTSDEIIYLDISKENNYDIRRNDLRHPNLRNIFDILEAVSKVCFMPITFGGKVRSLEDIRVRLEKGADKISMNTKPLEEPGFITEGAKEFGSQCIVVSMDVKIIDGEYKVMSHGGKENTGRNPIEWAKIVEDLGAGEIFLNSIDRDGAKTGYDIELIYAVSKVMKIPVIACGGVGEWEHFAEALEKTNADAVAAANIFQYTDQSVYLAKKFLYEKKFNVRNPDLTIF
jgi:cyclase